MKTLTIAIKDLTRSFRSMFLLAFMFAVPLMMTGMFYLMFGNTAQTASGSAAAPAAVKVVVANLDRGDPALAEGLAAFPGGAGMQNLGQVIAQTLQNPALNGLLKVSLAPDAASARQAVENKQADAAVIIPAQFSAAFVGPEGGAAIQLYQDPASSQAAAVLKAVLGQTLDGLSGARIAINVALAGGSDPAVIGAVVQRYTAAVAVPDPAGALLDVRAAGKAAPAGANANPMGQMLAPIMGGMMILFAFFTGGASSESILREDRSILDLINGDFTFLDERLALRLRLFPHFASATRRTVSSKPSSAPKRSFTVANGEGSLISFLAAKAIETSRRW